MILHQSLYKHYGDSILSIILSPTLKLVNGYITRDQMAQNQAMNDVRCYHKVPCTTKFGKISRLPKGKILWHGH